MRLHVSSPVVSADIPACAKLGNLYGHSIYFPCISCDYQGVVCGCKPTKSPRKFLTRSWTRMRNPMLHNHPLSTSTTMTRPSSRQIEAMWTSWITAAATKAKRTKLQVIQWRNVGKSWRKKANVETDHHNPGKVFLVRLTRFPREVTKTQAANPKSSRSELRAPLQSQNK